MKITIEKRLTTLDKLERTKQQAKEFKAMYTDGDLLRMFRDAIDGWEYGYSDEIIRCNLEAFPGGTMETDETHYSVDMVLEGYKRFTKLHFYITQSGEVDVREVWNGSDGLMKMYSIEEYKAA